MRCRSENRILTSFMPRFYLNHTRFSLSIHHPDAPRKEINHFVSHFSTGGESSTDDWSDLDTFLGQCQEEKAAFIGLRGRSETPTCANWRFTKAHEVMESVLLLQKVGKVQNILFIGEKFFHQAFPLAVSQSLKSIYQDIQQWAW